MMGSIPRLMGLFAVIPATLFLTVSFFVLVVLRKIEDKALKGFGYVIVALLWFASALACSMGIYVASTGRHPMMCMMHDMMKERMGEMGEMRGMRHGKIEGGTRGHMGYSKREQPRPPMETQGTQNTTENK